MKNILIKFKSNYKKDQKGMTIIELLVVIAIFMILTSITIFDYSSFRSSVSLDNLASDIALSVRKAQSYAIGVKSDSSSFNYGYGIRFSTAAPNGTFSPTSGTNKNLILFNDADDDKVYSYDGASICSGECKEILTVKTLDKINGFYFDDAPNSKQNGSLDIVFLRPNTDAYFCYKANPSSLSCNKNFYYVKIEISNGLAGTKEKFRKITVWNTGQISME